MQKNTKIFYISLYFAYHEAKSLNKSLSMLKILRHSSQYKEEQIMSAQLIFDR